MDSVTDAVAGSSEENEVHGGPAAEPAAEPASEPASEPAAEPAARILDNRDGNMVRARGRGNK